MAQGNMILTLVANTQKWSKGMRSASDDSLTFGKVVKMGVGMALGALTALTGALIFFLPNFIKMGEEARKSELRLANIATQMGVFGENTEKVTKRLSKYAETISFATGVDDELVRGAEAILLTFSELAKTADTTGGAFDRATMAAVDLAAAGFGDLESNAKQLGKALQDPVSGLTALRKAGVTFTEDEKKRIKVLVQSNRLLEAQDVVLSAIEKQVGGTAEATASATEKMAARFENVGETLSLALLPAVDEIATELGDWLDSVEGQKAIEDLTQDFRDFGAWITGPDGKKAVENLVTILQATADALLWINDQLVEGIRLWEKFFGIQKDMSLQGAPGMAGYRGGNTNSSLGARPGIPAPTYPTYNPNVTVNVTGLTPSAYIARTVVQAQASIGRYGR